MMRKLAAAVIAVSLIAGPALAQGTAPITTTNQPAVKADVKEVTVKKHAHKVTKSHAAKAVKHVKHAKHVKHIKHVKRVKQTTEQTRG